MLGFKQVYLALSPAHPTLCWPRAGGGVDGGAQLAGDVLVVALTTQKENKNCDLAALLVRARVRARVRGGLRGDRPSVRTT